MSVSSGIPFVAIIGAAVLFGIVGLIWYFASKN